MVVLELDDIEIDYCPSCEGIWLDREELNLLLDDSKDKELILSSFRMDYKTRERKLKCPICKRRMVKVLIGLDKKTRIDGCPKQHGFWFDRGELKSILMGSRLRENQIIIFLGKFFNAKTSSLK